MKRLRAPRLGLWLRTLMVVAGSIALVGLAGAWLWSLLRVDAFSKFRGGDQPVGEETGILMQDVRLALYEGSALEATASVDRIDVRRDRSLIRLANVHDGAAMRNGKLDFRFSAEQAEWEYFARRLLGRTGGHVTNDRFDLRSDAFVWDANAGRLDVPGKIVGTLEGGELQAQNVVYYPKTQRVDLGPARWQGPPPQELQAGPKRKAWTFTSKGPSRSEGDVSVWRTCEATDGEIVIRSDEVRYNRKTDELAAKGNVRYWGEDVNLTCEQAMVYRKDRRAVFTGGVTMLVKPKASRKLEVVEIPPFRPIVPEEIASTRPAAPPEKPKVDLVRGDDNLRDYPTQVWAGKIEYWYGKGNRHAILTGSPQAKQDVGVDEWRMVWAFEGAYDGELERLKLTSRPGQKDARMLNSIGDDLRASWFEVDTQEETDVRRWDAMDLSGEVYVDEDELPEPPGTKPPPAKP